ncbi:MAG: hypothetical protein AB1397_05820 [bacterium]
MKKPMDPKWLILISFLSSFLIGGIVGGFNYERLGMPEKKKKTIIYTILGFIVLFIIAIIFPSLPWLSFFGVNIGIGIYLSQKQYPDYIRWKLKQMDVK